jgi:chemotaxis protein histidine kinase CheA
MSGLEQMRPSEPTAAAAQLASGIARIKQVFVTSLKDRVNDFLELMELFNDPAQENAACAGFQALSHKLHGQALSLGFDKIGNAAAKLEAYLDLIIAGKQTMDIPAFSGLLNDLLDEIEKEIVSS